MAKELIASIDIERWKTMTPEEKQQAVDAFNATVNEARKKAGKPPLKT